jgi:hypothetical protein
MAIIYGVSLVATLLLGGAGVSTAKCVSPLVAR